MIPKAFAPKGTDNTVTDFLGSFAVKEPASRDTSKKWVYSGGQEGEGIGV